MKSHTGLSSVPLSYERTLKVVFFEQVLLLSTYGFAPTCFGFYQLKPRSHATINDVMLFVKSRIVCRME